MFTKPNVCTAADNTAVQLGRNLIFSVILGGLTWVILLAALPLCMLSASFGGVFLAGVGNHAVREAPDEPSAGVRRTDSPAVLYDGYGM